MATFLALFFLLKNHEEISYDKIFLIFVLYWNGYLYTKFQSRKKMIRKVLCFNFLSFFTIVVLVNDDWFLLFKILIIGGLGAFYNSSFLKYRIRKIHLLKIFYVGFVWAVLDSWLMFSKIHWDIFLICLFYISALVLPFDIRDREVDTILTFPKKIGIKRTKFLAYILILLSIFFSFVLGDKIFFNAFLLSGIVASIFVFCSNQNRTYLYYAFGVETCCPLPFLFLMLENYFK